MIGVPAEGARARISEAGGVLINRPEISIGIE
jgi:hypothetical protein